MWKLMPLVSRCSMLERTLLQGVCLGVCLSTAHAQNTTKSPSDRSWIVTLGAGTEYGPSFEGSRHASFSFVPSFDIRRWGEPAGLSAPDDGFDYSLFELGGAELGPCGQHSRQPHKIR